jgi:hypothetical protein
MPFHFRAVIMTHMRIMIMPLMLIMGRMFRLAFSIVIMRHRFRRFITRAAGIIGFMLTLCMIGIFMFILNLLCLLIFLQPIQTGQSELPAGSRLFKA